MRDSFRMMIVHLINSPKRLFLVDSTGAMLTAILLLTIQTGFQRDFGMPANILGFLLLAACSFCIYSISCYFLIQDRWRPFLKIIAIANLLYACTTCSLILCFYQEMTRLGVIYFSLEISIILLLVLIEFRVFLKSKEQTPQTKTEKYEHFKP